MESRNCERLGDGPYWKDSHEGGRPEMTLRKRVPVGSRETKFNGKDTGGEGEMVNGRRLRPLDE